MLRIVRNATRAGVSGDSRPNAKIWALKRRLSTKGGCLSGSSSFTPHEIQPLRADSKFDHQSLTLRISSSYVVTEKVFAALMLFSSYLVPLANRQPKRMSIKAQDSPEPENFKSTPHETFGEGGKNAPNGLLKPALTSRPATCFESSELQQEQEFLGIHDPMQRFGHSKGG